VSRGGTVLAFDFGEKRIGVAVGETEIGVAHPLETIDATQREPRFRRIGELISEWRPACLVVGLPTHVDGTPHEMTDRARRFGRQLEGRFGLPVRFVDERLTSAEAALALREAGVRSRGHRALRDRVAAQIILQSYLDARGDGT
jgi:putative Holliday junction resolvase